VTSTALEHSANVVAITDEDHRIIWANPAFTRNTGYELDEIRGQRPSEFLLVTPPTPDDLRAREDALATTGRWQGQVVNRRKDGSRYVAALTLAVTVDQDGIRRHVGIEQDLSAVYTAQIALQESEAKYRSLFENMGDGLLLLTADGTIFDTNDQACTLFGLPRSLIIGKTPADLSPVEQSDGRRSEDAAQAINTAVVAGTSQRFEWQHRRADGTPFDVEVILDPLQLRGTSMLQATLRDITQRKQASALLQESERRFRELADLLPQAVVESDTTGRVIFWNRAALALTGYTDEDFRRGLRSVDLVHPDDREHLLAERPYLLINQSGLVEYRFQRKDGRIVPVAVYAGPIVRENTAVGIRWLLIDMTTQKAAAEVLRKQAEQLATVRTVATEITRELDLTGLLQLILTRAIHLLGVQSGSLFLWEPETEDLVLAIQHGDADVPVRRKLGAGLAGLVAQAQQGIYTNRYRDESFSLPSILNSSDLTAAIAEPLLYRDQLIGVVILHNRHVPDRTFDADDQTLLQLFAQQAAISIANARLYQASIANAERLQALLRAAKAVMVGLDLDTTLTQIADTIREFAHPDHFALYLADHKTQTLRAAYTDMPQAGYLVTIPIGAGLVSAVVRSGEHVYVADLAHDSRNLIPEANRAAGFRTFLGIPIRARGQVLGVMIFKTRTPRTYGLDDLSWYASFADQAAIAIENARLFESERRRRNQLDTILTLTTEIVRELDLTKLLRLILQRASGLVQAGGGCIALWSEPEQALVNQVVEQQPDEVNQFRFRLGEGMIGSVAATRKGLLVQDYPHSPYAHPTITEFVNATSAIAEPLLYRDVLIGVILLNNHNQPEHSFTAADHEVLALFAAQASIAIQNARLFGTERERVAERQKALEEHQAQTAFRQAILGSLAAHVAVLDPTGTILEVNDAWRHFAQSNGGAPNIVTGVGQNYLAALHTAAALDDPIARTALTGIKALLAGTEDRFELEYPCNSPDEERWFLLQATRLTGTYAGAVLVHINITERKRAEAHVGALLRSAEALLEHNDLATTLNRIVTEAAQISHCERVKLLLTDRDSQTLRLAASYGIIDPELTFPPLSGSLSGSVVTTGLPKFVANVQEDPGNLRAAFDAAHGFQTYLGLPVVIGHETVGVLIFNTRDAREYTPGDYEVLTAFAHQAALAIQKARLLDTEQTRSQQLEAVRTLTSEITRELNLPRLMSLIVEHASQMVGCPGAFLYLWDADCNHLSPGARHGFSLEAVAPVLEVGEGLAGRVAASRTPLCANDYLASGYVVPRYADTYPSTAVAGEPLLYRGELLGVLTVNHQAPDARFGTRDTDILHLFAQHAAIAVANARLHTGTQRRVEQLAALYHLSGTLTAAVDPTAVADALRAAATTALPGTIAQVWECQDPPGSLQLRGTPVPGEEPIITRVFRPGQGLVGLAVERREVVLATDLSTNFTWINQAWAQTAGLHAAVAIPLLHDDHCWGALLVCTTTPHQFARDDEDIQILQAVANHGAAAFEKAHLFQAEQDRAAQLETLLHTTHALLGGGELSDLLTYLVTMASEITRTPKVKLLLVDAETGTLYYGAYQGDHGPRAPMKISEGLSGIVAETRHPLYVADMREDPRNPSQDADRAVGNITYLGFPVCYEGQILGVLSFDCPTLRTFSDAEIMYLTAFAEHAAVAIRHAQILAAATTKTAQLKSLQAVTQEIIRELDLAPLLQAITERAAALVVDGCAAVWLWNPTEDTLVINTWTKYGEWMRDRRLRLGEGIAGLAAQERRSLLINDYRTHPHAHPITLEHSNVTAILTVPLFYRDQLLGVLVIDNAGDPHHRFTNENRELLELFAAQAAIAIHNAQITAQVTKHAQRLATLGEATQGLGRLRSPAAVGAQVLDAAEALYPDAGFVIRRWDATRAALHLIGHRGLRYPDTVPIYGTAYGLATRAYHEARPVNVTDLQATPGISDQTRTIDEGFRSSCIHPLLFEGTPTGTLSIYWRTPYEVSANDTHVIGILAANAAIAFKNADLYETAQQEIDQRRQTEDQLRHRTEQLETVRQVATDMAQELDLDRLLQMLTDRAAELFHVERSSLYLWTPGTQQLIKRPSAGHHGAEEVRTIQLGDGVTGTAAASRQGVCANDYPASPLANPIFIEHGLRAVMAEPLLVHDRLLGVLNVGTVGPTQFTPEDQQLLNLLAIQAAIAIQNARLFDDRVHAQHALEARTQQLETARKITEQITQVRDPDELLTLILDRVQAVVPAHIVTIRLWDDTTQTLALTKAIGAPPSGGEGLPLALGEGVAGTAAARRQGLIENDFSQSPYYTPRLSTPGERSRILAEPLLFNNEIIGVLGLKRLAEHEPFTPTDQASLQLFAAQMAIAIMNARDRAQLAANERHLSGLLETAEEGILSTNAAHVITFANRKMAEFLGCEGPEALIDRPYLELVAPHERPAAEASWATSQHGEAVHMERTLLTHDGRPRIFLVNAGPVFGPDGTFQGALGMYTDITARKQAEIAIQTVHAISEDISKHLELPELLQAIAAHTYPALRATSCAVWQLDPKAQILRRAAWAGGEAPLQPETIALGAGVTGTVALTRQGICVADLAASEYRDGANLSISPHQAVLAEPLIHSGTLFGVLTLNRTAPDAHFDDAEVQLVQLLSRQLSVAINTAMLFTELNDSHTHLLATMDQMVKTEKLRAVGQMAAGVAHELNNTLQGVLSGIQTLQEKQNLDDAPPTPEELADLAQAVRFGGAIVRQLLDFTRQRPLSTPEPLALGPILAHVLRTGRSAARDRIQQHVTITPNLPPVLGVPSKLSEVFLNLIINACDAMPEGGHLYLTASPAPVRNGGPDEVVVTFRDTGCGMTPEVRDRIFEPFFSTKGAKGTGLGMAVVYGTVEQHKGRIEIDSVVGEGTTVRVTLPATALPIPGAATHQEPAARGARLRILLVDDEDTVRHFVGNMIETRGHTVVRTGTPAEVPAILDRQPIDLVITDYFMPTDNGVDLAGRIKAAHPDLPIFLLTGLVDEAAEAAHAEGIIDRLVEKPLDIRQLVTHLAAFQPRVSAEMPNETPAETPTR
jgi:PAS domain S-box-containing protein